MKRVQMARVGRQEKKVVAKQAAVFSTLSSAGTLRTPYTVVRRVAR